MLSPEERVALYTMAKEAVHGSYSPYSNFAVGAAVRVASGEIFQGANVENASYGLTICAERVAVCSAVCQSHRDIVAVAVHSASGGASPCGACRQFIAEFGGEIEVIYMHEGHLVSHTASGLLPNSFSGKELNR